MTLAELAIKKPVFITSALALTLITGLFFMREIGVSMYPDVNFPLITVMTSYPGAGPEDIESRITKPLEDAISATAGMKKIVSQSKDGVSIVTAQFTLETDGKYALQQVRDKVSVVRPQLPEGIVEPTVSLLNMDDTPVLTVSLTGDLDDRALFELAEYTVRPRLEQADGIGRVEIQGGRRREIQVELERRKLAAYEISAAEVVRELSASGRNVPAGKKSSGDTERSFRMMGEFASRSDIENAVLRFSGNDVPVRVSDLGRAVDGRTEETTLAFRNGRATLAIPVYKQSRYNTIKAAGSAKLAAAQLAKELAVLPGSPKLEVVQDGTKAIAANVGDVKETIVVSIILTVLVVLLFLRSVRSTLITVLAIPNSLIGAFALMYFAGFSVNIMSLLALSLSVGLLVDDAIVVRENIFRRMRAGEAPAEAARLGTEEVRLAVIATSLTVAAVFLPIAFMKGIVGQYFKEFGLTVCFVLLISTFDSLTIAPMLSAYFSGVLPAGGKSHAGPGALMRFYERGLRAALRSPLAVLGLAAALFAASLWAAMGIPAVFLPPAENGEFFVSLEGAPDLTVRAMAKQALQVDEALRADGAVANTMLVAGGREGEPNKASIFVELKPARERKLSTSLTQERLRGELKKFARLNPLLTEGGEDGGDRPITIVMSGEDARALNAFASAFYARFSRHPAITDPELSEKPGKPEVRISLDQEKARLAGVAPAAAGEELRAQLEGVKVSTLRERGHEYDVRVRLKEEDRDLQGQFREILVPNMNGRLIKLARVAVLRQDRAPQGINRLNRMRYISFGAGLAPGGPGMQAFVDEMERALRSELKPPDGITVAAEGDAENYAELLTNVGLAMLLGVCFIYLVLASLYESFTAPFAILLVIPLAACGAFFALRLGGLSIDVYSIIGCVLLLGIAAKNSILLVDRIRVNLGRGLELLDAVLDAGRTRLRPILMTSGALVAGMGAVAAGLNEASAQRTGMGWAVIGGLISSTLLSLFVVPAAYALIDRVKVYVAGKR